ncbi:MAG TPA: glutamate--tRNA ligase [Candidatus Paceibacterota bacterium]|nr:glutamate--tRNA ligase [Candidatus Paceibacterota bacterium]
MNKKIVTRFAPSPTGFLHIGGVRTALFAWAFARKNNGTFILRIEDTDKAREVEGSIQHIIDSLKWVGITWDEGIDIGGPNAPYLQSERLESYKKYAQKLVDKGLAYADPYTPEEVEAFRVKAQEEKRPFLFRDHRPENPPVWDGTQPLRFKVTDIKTTHWNDLVYGDLSAGPEALDDFIIIKSDGYPTYNLSHMIDDLEMGVTHIMRADEFIASTPKFLALYEALEITPPLMATLPPIMAPDGKKKLGKRDGAKDILDYKAEGYLPEAMLNFLVFIGWSPKDEREVMTAQEFIDAFEIERIHRSGGGFNVDKLDWFNREHLKKLSVGEQKSYVQKFLPERFSSLSDSMLDKLVPVIVERIHHFSEVAEMAEQGEFDYYINAPSFEESKLIWKTDTLDQAKDHLKKVCELLNDYSGEWNSEEIKSVIWDYAESVGRGSVLWPMRYALSGRDKSPDPFILADILGKDETLKRLQSHIV